MNNKGFAVSSIIYGILIIFLIVVASILSLLITRGSALNKIKKNALSAIKGNDTSSIPMDAIVADFSTINITSDAPSYTTINYNINVYSPFGYEIRNSISGAQITYTAYDNSNVVDSVVKNIQTNAEPLVEDYKNTDGEEKVLLSPGLYKLEVWGAENSNPGGYSVGYLYTEEMMIIYINVGSKSGYNGSATHIAKTSGILSNLNSNDVIISAGGNGTVGIASASLKSSNVIGTSTCPNKDATSNCTKSGNGYARITSLIYYTK
ncbi:MAG: hypothetical protein IJ565_05255 [Bacilli bacterium]|nr:hypothetical protein [Bacilli bacterium]